LLSFEVKHRQALPQRLLALSGECVFLKGKALAVTRASVFREFLSSPRPVTITESEVVPTKFILDAYDQAVKSATQGQVPVVVLHAKRMRIEDSIIIIGSESLGVLIPGSAFE
jgi:carboxylesterase type B